VVVVGAGVGGGVLVAGMLGAGVLVGGAVVWGAVVDGGVVVAGGAVLVAGDVGGGDVLVVVDARPEGAVVVLEDCAVGSGPPDVPAQPPSRTAASTAVADVDLRAGRDRVRVLTPRRPLARLGGFADRGHASVTIGPP